jgi:hypothetical protein
VLAAIFNDTKKRCLSFLIWFTLVEKSHACAGSSLEAEFWNEILRVFLLAIHGHLYSFALRKEENLIENHIPFPMVQEIHTENSNLRTVKIMP